MGQVSATLRKVTGGYGHWCPGCNMLHILPTEKPYSVNWTFNGDIDKPTFTPSFKHTHHMGKVTESVCHYIITDGVIDYLGDSTAHELRGKMPLFPLPAEWVDDEP